MSNLSRRSIVASAAALPSLTIPAVAIAAVAEPDPIYAAIGDFKKAHSIEEGAYQAIELAVRDARSREEREDLEDAAYDAASERIEAMYAVFETVPTTLAGMRAKIDFAGGVDHVTESLQQTHDPKRLKDFLETLYKCAERLAA
jgi:hypothetical protein